MNASPSPGRLPTVIVGGGFAGALCALKLAKAGEKTVLIEKRRVAGRGLAYGACSPFHLLNVPASRMEIGLAPRFVDWLAQRPAEIAEALPESEGRIEDAFVPRALFGRYLQERIEETLIGTHPGGLAMLRGEAIRLSDAAARTVLLDDGREIRANRIVLATGNLPPRLLTGIDSLRDAPFFVPDPWAPDAFDELDRHAPVVLIGTGLTMVDVVQKLVAGGHSGKMLAISRHGLLPSPHRAGGAWHAFAGWDAKTPLALAKALRAELRNAEARGLPWQRVIDAMRPANSKIWDSWSERERKQFLRHLRSRWDVLRHRMPERTSTKIRELIDDGQLRVAAGRIRNAELRAGRAELSLALRSGRSETVEAARVINCTGPRTDITGHPFLADLHKRGLIRPDRLGLGIETRDCAVLGTAHVSSDWLFAVGPLTRPSVWEITAVPEIRVQIDRLVSRLTKAGEDRGSPLPSLVEEFLDLGAGI